MSDTFVQSLGFFGSPHARYADTALLVGKFGVTDAFTDQFKFPHCSALVFQSPVATDEKNRQPNWTTTDLDRTAVAHPGGRVIRSVAVVVTQAKVKDRLQPVATSLLCNQFKLSRKI